MIKRYTDGTALFNAVQIEDNIDNVRDLIDLLKRSNSKYEIMDNTPLVVDNLLQQLKEYQAISIYTPKEHYSDHIPIHYYLIIDEQKNLIGCHPDEFLKKYIEVILPSSKIKNDEKNNLFPDIHIPINDLPIKEPDPLAKQVGGGHYKEFTIQPVEFITANNIGFIEGNVIKYVCRHEHKNGRQDIEKAIHYLELLLTIKYKEVEP